jgi:hypothetical protein
MTVRWKLDGRPTNSRMVVRQNATRYDARCKMVQCKTSMRRTQVGRTPMCRMHDAVQTKVQWTNVRQNGGMTDGAAKRP